MISRPTPSSRAPVTSAAASCRRRPGDRTRGRSPAFTLIEILIVVSLLVAAAAIVVPLSASTFAERRFENTMDRVSGHLLSARLESMERRLPVEVIWMQGQMHSRIFDPDLVQPVSPGVVDERDADAEGLSPELASTLEEPQDSLEVFDFPPGTTCRDSEPGVIESIPGILSDGEAVESLRIAVYLPDGSVIERGPRWIVDADGRTAALWIDRRTGFPALNRRTVIDPLEDEREEDEFTGPDLDSVPPDPGDGDDS